MKYIIIISLFLVSCNMQKYIANHPELLPPEKIVTKEITTVKDSISYLPADSSLLAMLFECDSNNNVLMRNLEESTSKGLKTNITFKDNKLNISMNTDSLAILHRIIDNLKTKEVIKVNPVNIELQKKVIELEKKCDTLDKKAKTKNKIIFILIATIIAGLLALKVFR